MSSSRSSRRLAKRVHRHTRRFCSIEPLESRALLTAVPFVVSTSPTFSDDPAIVSAVPAGLDSVKIEFDQSVLNAEDPASYDLRGAGADGAFDTADDRVETLVAEYSGGKTAMLRFSKIPVDVYRLSVFDEIGILDGSQFVPLDGDGDTVAGGDYVRQFEIVPGVATKFAISGVPSSVGAGEQQMATLTALDAYGNVATSYANTVAWTSGDTRAELPASYTFTAADAGVHTFAMTLNSVGDSHWIKATDTQTGTFKSQTGISVTSATISAGSLSFTGFPTEVEAGLSQSFVLSALDGAGNLKKDYAGLVEFSSTDPLASLPAAYQFTSADGGDRTFSATLKTAGIQQLTATDVGTGESFSISINVLPTAVSKFTVAGFPSPTIAGESHEFTVVAADKYGNVATGYTGTVAFTSSDTNAILPPNYTFTAEDQGRRTFVATLLNTGTSRSIVATDTVTSATGKQTGIQVQASFIRYASSSNTIIVDGGSATLSKIHLVVPDAPLTRVDSDQAIWKLDANVRIINGGSLLLHGTAIGGDVNELRLRSENTDAADAIIEVRADYGDIHVDSTFITSWDSAAGGPDTEYDLYKRSYIRARSRLADDQLTPLQSRMDILNSEVAYLGYYGPEAYGLTWKVVGDPGPNHELYGQVDVLGDIMNSHIHHLYFGVYTYGAFGMQIIGNEVAYNVAYGIDPHDDSDELRIEGNYAHHNGTHGIIASQRCNDLVIRNNISSDNGGNGIMLHRNSNRALVEGNLVENNDDSGIAIFDSHDNVVQGNTSRYNKHGIRFSVGASNNWVEANEFSYNTQRGLQFYQGSDLPTSGDGRPKNNTFLSNVIVGNLEHAIRLRDSDDNVFEANTISGNGRNNSLLFDGGVGNTLRNNIFGTVSVVDVRGTADRQSTIIIDDQPGIHLVLDEYSIAIYV